MSTARLPILHMPSCCAQRQPGPFTMGTETIFEIGKVLELKKCSAPQAWHARTHAHTLSLSVPKLRCTAGKG
jgi:hypothetical protein